jgi:hypothetical protein
MRCFALAWFGQKVARREFEEFLIEIKGLSRENVAVECRFAQGTLILTGEYEKPLIPRLYTHESTPLNDRLKELEEVAKHIWGRPDLVAA